MVSDSFSQLLETLSSYWVALSDFNLICHGWLIPMGGSSSSKEKWRRSGCGGAEERYGEDWEDRKKKKQQSGCKNKYSVFLNQNLNKQIKSSEKEIALTSAFLWYCTGKSERLIPDLGITCKSKPCLR